MKIYTKTGDSGETGLFGGQRVSKCSIRVSAYGDVDELNSVLGVLRSEAHHTELLESLQSRLFDVGAELANPKGKQLGIPLVDEEDVLAIERAIDHFEATLPPLTSFILPGGTRLAAHFHLARTVCRRAERSVIALHEKEPVRMELIRYLNRLSDLFFVLAREANAVSGVADIPWAGRVTRT